MTAKSNQSGDIQFEAEAIQPLASNKKPFSKITMTKGVSKHTFYVEGAVPNADEVATSGEALRKIAFFAVSSVSSDDAWFSCCSTLLDCGWIDERLKATKIVEDAVGKKTCASIKNKYNDEATFLILDEYCKACAEPFTEQWYSVKILFHMFVDKNAFLVGYLWSELRQKNWNEHALLVGIDALQRNRENSPKGAQATKALKKDRISIMKSLAFAPETILKWIGKSDREKARFLRQLAGSYDASRTESQLFQHNGCLLSLNWFANAIADWQSDGDIDSALNKLRDNR